MNIKTALSCAVIAFLLSLGLLGWVVFATTTNRDIVPKFGAQPTFTPPPVSVMQQPVQPVASPIQQSSFVVFNIGATPLSGARVEIYTTDNLSEPPAAAENTDANGRVVFKFQGLTALKTVRATAEGYLPVVLRDIPLPAQNFEIYLDEAPSGADSAASATTQQNSLDTSETTPKIQPVTVNASFSPNKSTVKQIVSGSVMLAWYDLRTMEDNVTRWYLNTPTQVNFSGTKSQEVPGQGQKNQAILVAFWDGLLTESAELDFRNGVPVDPIALDFTPKQELSIAVRSADTRAPVLDADVSVSRLRTPKAFGIETAMAARADESGIVKIVLQPGDYKIEAKAPGFSPEVQLVKAVGTTTFLTDILLQPQLPGLDIHVTEGNVSLKKAPLTMLSKSSEKSNTVFSQTDEKGKSFFKDINPETTYTVIVTHPANTLRQKSIDVFYGAKGTFRHEEIAFGEPLRIGGTVTEKSGADLVGKTLRFTTRGDATPTAETTIRPNGLWSTELEVGEYVIQLPEVKSNSEIITIKDGDAMKQYDLVF